MNSKKRIWCLIFSLMMFLSIFTGDVYAGTAEKAKANAYYRNPVTGEIDDPGNNYGIGQGMVESVLYREAEITEENGSLSASVRYLMKDYLSNFKIEILNSDGSYSETPFTASDYGEDMIMLNFSIPSRDVTIRARAFVEPMGREVVFFYNFSDFRKDEELLREDSAVDENSLYTEEKKEDTVNNKTISYNLQNDMTSHTERTSDEQGLLMKNSKELEEYLNKDAVNKTKEVKKTEYGPVTKMFINGFIIFIYTVMGIMFSFALLVRYIAFSLEKFNRRLEEKLYEDK